MKNFQEESSVWSQNFNPRNVADAEIERNPTTAEASGSFKDSQHQDLAVLMVNFVLISSIQVFFSCNYLKL